jgi:hypothetical protein
VRGHQSIFLVNSFKLGFEIFGEHERALIQVGVSRGVTRCALRCSLPGRPPHASGYDFVLIHTRDHRH